jgi:hypothetical protein
LYPQGTRTPPRLRRNEEDTWDSGFCLSSPNSPNIFLEKSGRLLNCAYDVTEEAWKTKDKDFWGTNGFFKERALLSVFIFNKG